MGVSLLPTQPSALRILDSGTKMLHALIPK